MLNQQTTPLAQKTVSVEGSASPRGGGSLTRLCSNISSEKLPNRLVLAPSFCSREVGLGYRVLLNRLELDYSLWYEFRGFKAYRCEMCKTTVFQPMIDCGRYHPWASARHTSRAVHKTLERLERIHEKTGFDYLICLDLTIRKEDADPKNLPQLRKSVRVFLDLLSRHLTHKGKLRGSLTGVFAIHIWSTKSLTPHNHVHLNIPNVLKTKNGYVRFSPKLDHSVIKMLWREALRKNGLWYDRGILPNLLPDCYLSFKRFKNRAGVAHRIRYISRLPIVDLSENLTPDQARGFDLEWAEILLNYTPRVVWVGWARGGGFGNSSEKRNRGEGLTCPKCGWTMTYLGVQEPDPDIAWFAEQRDGSFAFFINPCYTNRNAYLVRQTE